jgi:hypothetical protein
MKNRLGLFVLLFFSSFIVNAQSVETKLSSGIGFDGEPNMVVNPSNPRHMVVAWMSLGVVSPGTLISINTRTTFDGGKTWSASVALPHFASKWGSADPTMAFHKNGKLYLVYIDYRQVVDSGGVYLFSSSNGGLAWNYESRILDGTESTKMPLDRPWLAVDNSGTASDGTLYVTTKPAPWIPAPNRPYLKVSTDGKNWSTTRFIDTTGFLVGNLIQAPMAAPAVTKSGKFVVAFPSFVTAQSVYPKYYLGSSTSKGATFNYFSLLTNPGNTGDTNLKGGYQLLAHPEDPKSIVFLRVDNKLGDADIIINRTTDEGKTWGSNIRVNDDTIANGKLQDLAWANWGKKGELAVCWRDRRNSSGKGFVQSSDCYCAMSTDSGKTFGKNIRMTANSAAFNNVLYQSGNDFMSCGLNGDTLVAVWGDVRNNKLEIWESTVNWKQNTNAIKQLIVSEDLPELRVWPNPAKRDLNYYIGVPVTQPNLIIENNQGKIVKEVPIKNNGKIDIADLSVGIYFLVGTGENGAFGSRFEVIK